MKLWILNFAFISLFFSLSAFSADVCQAKIKKKISATQSIFHAMAVPVLEKKFEMVKDIRTIENVGDFDFLVRVKGLGSAAWHRVNPDETYIGLVDLWELRCLSTSSPKRDPLSIGFAVLTETVDGLWDSLQSGAPNLAGELGAASQCRTRGYGNTFAGSRNKFQHFINTPDYRLMNNYLAMQASIRTYYQQFANGRGYATTENDYRCAAQEQYRHWGFKKVLFANSITSGNAIIASNRDFVLIAVRGTQMVDEQSIHDEQIAYNFMTDILANGPSIPLNASLLIPNAKGKLHSGYAAVVKTLFPLIEQALREMGDTHKPIFLAGHSLGGATATVLGYKLRAEGYKVQSVYSFASPKIGDLRFTQDLDSNVNVYATINYRDPVPGFPNISNFLNFVPQYYAADHVLYFNKNHQPTDFPNTTRDSDIFARISEDQGSPTPLIISATQKFKEWHFHVMNFYLAFLYNEIQQNQLDRNSENLQPDYQKQWLCLDGQPHRNLTQIDWYGDEIKGTLLADTNGYPVQECVLP
ncbi:lipase family protein [Vibrio penaeicida]|uniref:lipase family protein n=1 Tax=Vibrio penaeicida TaxID=104609 RepID=UPI000CEA185B|nr:lipase family protein [Vibrio penaeicida]